MTLGFLTALRTTRATAIETLLDAGSTGALIDVYSGTRPATGAGIGASVLLSTLTCSKPAGSVSNGVLTLNAVTNGTGTAGAGAGTSATWCRFRDSNSTFVMDGSVGTSGADLNLNSVIIATGQTVSVTSGTITEGNV